MVIEGTVAPGFESVKQLYEHNMRSLAERNTQLCVYVGEERVVDLWASAVDDATFSPDSLVNVFSSGKSLEAILLAMLVDRGLLDYDATIAHYWPEFGAKGKQQKPPHFHILSPVGGRICLSGSMIWHQSLKPALRRASAR